MNSNDHVALGLDPDWIAAQMETNGERPDVVLREFVGTGQMSRNARLDLTWRGDAGPATVIVKVPSTEAGTRGTAFEHGFYEKECEFYRSVLPLVDVVTPDVYAVYFDAPTHDFAIVLEDLVGSEQGDHFTEPTSEQLELAVDQLVALQAPVWGATSGSEFDILRNRPVDEIAAGSAAIVDACLPIVIERLGPGLATETTSFLERYPAVVADWVRQQVEPRTVTHGDFRPDNFMFGVSPEAPRLAIVDWQTLGLGAGPSDLAYLIGGSLDEGTRRDVEDSMIDRYLAGLRSRGIDYDAGLCRRDYAVGTLHGVITGIAATVMADETERGDALFTLMINRHSAHAIELDALHVVTTPA